MKPILFYFQFNLDEKKEEVSFSEFNEFCIFSSVLEHGDYFDYRVYTNKPGSFKVFPYLNSVVKFQQIPADIWDLGDKTIVGCRNAWRPSHLSDFFRYYYLREHAGVYMDTDIIVRNSFVPLVESPHDLILAKESPTKINGGVIVANKAHVGVLEDVFQNYFDDYRPDAWIYNTMTYLKLMVEANNHYDIIRILQIESGFHYPNYLHLDALLSTNQEEWEEIDKVYSHHICGNLSTIKGGRGLRQRIADIATGKEKPDLDVYIDNRIHMIMEKAKEIRIV